MFLNNLTRDAEVAAATGCNRVPIVFLIYDLKDGSESGRAKRNGRRETLRPFAVN
jgi:hypothetical protein